MNIKRILFIIVVGILVVSPIIALAENMDIGIANHVAGNEFINNMAESMQKRIKELGFNYQYVVADGRMVTHTTNIENLIGKGLKVVVIIGGDAEALKPMQDLAVESGVKLISADTGMVGKSVLTDVTSDNKLIGQLMAYFLIAKLDGEGKIAVFSEPFYTPTRIRWEEGAKPILDQFPNIKIIGDMAIEFPRGTEIARNAMETYLVSHPDLKGVWAAYDQPALGAIQALLAAGKEDVVVVGADGDKENVLKYIMNGVIQKVTVAQEPEIMGKMVADIAVQYIKGEKTEFPEHTYAPLTLLTKGNALLFAKKRGWIK